MIKTRQFIVIYAMAFCSVFLGYFAVNSFKTFGELNGISDSYLSLVGSIGAAFNAIRFIWSTALDIYSYKWVYGTLLVVQIIFGVLIV
jgi:hypothetical protein